MTTAGNGPSYRVDMSQQTRTALKLLHLHAAQKGNGARFVSAFRQIVAQLRQDPLTFGEPLYRLPVLKLDVRLAVVDGLVVVYGVHWERPLVFIRSFGALS